MIMEINEKAGLRGVLEVYERSKNKKGNFRGQKWQKIREQHNLITNVGMQTIANRLTGSGTYNSTYYTYFAIGDGSTAPVITDTAAIFYADCANDYTKSVATIETFSVPLLMQQWTCFLTSAENTVTSITKFALMNANPGTLMFNEVLFSAISKSSSKQLYFRYKLYLTEV
jgi:hypothetical protein